MNLTAEQEKEINDLANNIYIKDCEIMVSDNNIVCHGKKICTVDEFLNHNIRLKIKAISTAMSLLGYEECYP